MELHLSSERQAQLNEYAQRHEKDPAIALDEVLATALEWERHDYQAAVEGISRGYESVKAGHTRPASEFMDELRENMAFEVRTTPDSEQDAAEILDWLMLHHAGETGLRWFLRMDEAIASLLSCRHGASSLLRTNLPLPGKRTFLRPQTPRLPDTLHHRGRRGLHTSHTPRTQDGPLTKVRRQKFVSSSSPTG